MNKILKRKQNAFKRNTNHSSGTHRVEVVAHDVARPKDGVATVGVEAKCIFEK